MHFWEPRRAYAPSPDFSSERKQYRTSSESTFLFPPDFPPGNITDVWIALSSASHDGYNLPESAVRCKRIIIFLIHAKASSFEALCGFVASGNNAKKGHEMHKLPSITGHRRRAHGKCRFGRGHDPWVSVGLFPRGRRGGGSVKRDSIAAVRPIS